jgi:hypothetical protein
MRIKHKSIVSLLSTAVFSWAALLSSPAHGQAPDWHWGENPPPLFPSNEWGSVSNSCQLGLRVLKFQYETGERIFVALILRNVGDKDIDYGFRAVPEDYDVVVKRGDGQAVPITDWWAGYTPSGVSYMVTSKVVGPHRESLTASSWVNVTERYKMDAPGAYTITVKQHVVLFNEPSPTAPKRPTWKRFDLLSNPVTVTIVAPSSAKPEK